MASGKQAAIGLRERDFGLLRKSGRQLLRKVTPFKELEKVREKFLSALEMMYKNDPVIHDAFSNWDNPKMVREACKAARGARTHNPHDCIEGFIGLFEFLQKIVLAILAMLTVASWLLSLALYPTLASMYSTAGAPLSFLPIGATALVWLYVGLLRWNRDSLQVFNESLCVPEARIRGSSRDRSKLAAFYIWNTVIQGQVIPSIVCFLALADGIASLPLFRRFMDNPAGFILNAIAENSELYRETDGSLEVYRELYRRYR